MNATITFNYCQITRKYPLISFTTPTIYLNRFCRCVTSMSHNTTLWCSNHLTEENGVRFIEAESVECHLTLTETFTLLDHHLLFVFDVLNLGKRFRVFRFQAIEWCSITCSCSFNTLLKYAASVKKLGSTLVKWTGYEFCTLSTTISLELPQNRRKCLYSGKWRSLNVFTNRIFFVTQLIQRILMLSNLNTNLKWMQAIC